MEESYRSKLLSEGVDETTAVTVEEQFHEQFKNVLQEYNIELPSENQTEIISTGVEVLFEIIYEFGTDDSLDQSVQEYATEVANDTGQASRYNIHFVCGRAAAEYPDSQFAKLARQLRGEIALQNYGET